ncbi:MAG: ATP-binding protein, partial [Anaerolineales bacterium]
DSMADTPVALINGPRQSGKSTLARAVAPDAPYIPLDNAEYFAAAKGDPAGFVRGLPRPVVLDEVQRVPEVLLPIKVEVDRDRRPGSFLLSGSADVLLLPQVSESLAGRMETITLWPLSQGELEGRVDRFVDAIFEAQLEVAPGSGEGKRDLIRRVLLGGFPEVVRRPERRRDAWFAAYVSSILQRDVLDLAAIEGLTAMPRLLNLLAARNMSLANVAGLSMETGIPQTTLRRYLAILELSFLIQPLRPLAGSFAKRFVHAPRHYFADTGVPAHLTDATAESLRAKPDAFGPLLENFVIMELRKQLAWASRRCSMYFARTHAGQEVDIVLERAAGREVVGIEVKASTSVQPRDFKGLEWLRDGLGDRFVRGVVLYSGEQAVPFGDRLWALPVDALWRLGARPQ